MDVRRAVVREPGEVFSRCISTHPMKHTVDVVRAREQHRAYVETLEDLGLEVMRLDRDDKNPDSCFVEDTAVVHGPKALICRPAEESRRGEVGSIEEALRERLHVRRAEHPATIEGGDVLHLRDRLVSGVTRRTNDEGVRQLADWLEVRVDPVSDPAIMHLKSHVSHVRDGTILVTEAFAGKPPFEGLEKLVVPEGEEYAANILSVDGTVVMPAGFPKTKSLLEGAGVDVIVLEMTEFPKCDGAMTCLSILF